MNVTTRGQQTNDTISEDPAPAAVVIAQPDSYIEVEGGAWGQDVATPRHAYFTDGPLHTEMNAYLSEALPESGLEQGGFYDSEIGRELSKTIFDASLLTELTSEENYSESIPFSSTVEERYGKATSDDHLRVQIDPLGFASVQSIAAVPTFYTKEISEIITDYKETFLAIRNKLESADTTDVVSGIYDLAKMTIGEDTTQLDLAYAEVITKAQNLNEKYSETTNIPIHEFGNLFKPVADLTLNGVPFFMAVAKQYEAIKTALIARWNRILYTSGLTAWHEKECLERGILPSDLTYTSGGNFDTVEQNEFYTTLVGSTTPMRLTSSAVVIDAPAPTRTPYGVVTNPYPQFIDVPLGVAQKSAVPSAPASAAETIGAYRKALHDEILSVSLTMSMTLGDDMATLTAGDVLFSGQQGGDEKIINDGDGVALLTNTDPASLWHIYESQKFQIENEKGGGILSTLGIICGVSGLFDSLNDGLVVENLLKDTELAQDQGVVLELACGQIRDKIQEYLAGIIDLRGLYGALSLVFNNLNQKLRFSTGSRNGTDATLLYMNLGLWLGGMLASQREAVGVSLKDHPQSQDFFERYEKLQSLAQEFAQSATEEPKNIFSENVSQTISAMDEVLVVAQETLSLPTDYIESLKSWNDYPHFLIESQSREQNFNEKTAPLSHLVSDLLELKSCPEIFYAEVKARLSNIENAQALTLWVADLALRADGLEAAVLDYLRPTNAETFVNRLRYAIVVLKNESEVMHKIKQRKNLSVDELISQDVGQWSRQLNSGWPDAQGQSDVFGEEKEFTDTTITPNPEKYVNETDFALLLASKSGLSAFDAAKKLIEFIANPYDGYFYNFCLIGVQRNEDGLTVDTFRDYQNLNELRLILADIHKMTASKLACCPADDRSRLDDILYITAQLDLALAKITAKLPPSALWTQIQEGELAGMPYMNYYSEPTQGVMVDAASKAVTEARGILQNSMRYPDPLKGVLMNDYQVSSWVEANQDNVDMTELSTIGPELAFIEDLARSLPLSQKSDFLNPLLNNLGHYDTLYYVGRIFERLSLEPTSVHQARREHIKTTLVRTLTLADLENILTHWGSESDQLWPLEISSTKRVALSELQINATEMTWLAGFIGTTIFTNKLVQENDWLTDAVYQQELNLTEIDRHVDSMSRAEAGEMLKQISLHFALNEPHAPANQVETKAVISTVDEAWAANEKSRQVSRANLEVIARDTNAAKLNESEYMYAVVLISNELYNAPTQDELVRYQTYFSSHGGINIKKVVAVVNRLSAYEKELFYVAHRDMIDSYYVTLAEATITHINGESVVLAEPLIRFLDGLFVTSDNYIDTAGAVDAESLINDFDAVLAVSYPQKTTLDGYLAESILYLLDAVTEKLKNSNAVLTNVFEVLRRAFTISFNKDDSVETASVSSFNPNGYNLPRFAAPKIGIEQVFALANLSALMKQSGEDFPTDPELKNNIETIYDGIFEYFRTPASLYLYETDAGLLCLDEGKLYVIIDDEKIELTFDSWLMYGDGKTARLSENPLAQEIFVEAFGQIQGQTVLSPSALELQSMYVAVQSHLEAKALAAHAAEQAQALHRTFGDYKAVSIINKYFPEMMCQALAMKKRNAQIAADYSDEAFAEAMGEISNELDLALFDLSMPALAQGEKIHGTN